MARGINTVALVGRLTRDPELKHIGSDMAVCDLSLAVNGSEKRNGEWQDRPDFFEVVTFGKVASNCAEYLTKGQEVAIAGRLRQDRWQTDAGDNRSKVKVIASEVQFGAKPHGSSSPVDTSGFDGE